jgi:hypothetical protein
MHSEVNVLLVISYEVCFVRILAYPSEKLRSVDVLTGVIVNIAVFWDVTP